MMVMFVFYQILSHSLQFSPFHFLSFFKKAMWSISNSVNEMIYGFNYHFTLETIYFEYN